MNRRSVLNIIFDDEEAGQLSDDELSDECEKGSDYEDEIDYSTLNIDMVRALDLEQDLLASSSSMLLPVEPSPTPEAPPKRKLGRPLKNKDPPLSSYSVPNLAVARPTTSTGTKLFCFCNRVRI
jgi:hypothetical protein